MNPKINEAIAKLTEEATKAGDPLSIFIEEHLTDKITNEDIANKILDEDKTIAALIKQIKAKAKEQAVNGVGAVSDDDVRKMTDEYFGIDNAEPKKMIDVMDLL